MEKVGIVITISSIILAIGCGGDKTNAKNIIKQFYFSSIQYTQIKNTVLNRITHLDNERQIIGFEDSIGGVAISLTCEEAAKVIFMPAEGILRYGDSPLQCIDGNSKRQYINTIAVLGGEGDRNLFFYHPKPTNIFGFNEIIQFKLNKNIDSVTEIRMKYFIRDSILEKIIPKRYKLKYYMDQNLFKKQVQDVVQSFNAIDSFDISKPFPRFYNNTMPLDSFLFAATTVNYLDKKKYTYSTIRVNPAICLDDTIYHHRINDLSIYFHYFIPEH